jgi:putative heme-binding domain-containing protein
LVTLELDVLALRGLALYADAEIAATVLQRYRRLSAPARPAAIDLLASRAATAKLLLNDVASGKIERADVTAFHARQIRGFNDKALTPQLASAWGELRDSSADKRKLVTDLKAKLTSAELAQANRSNGRVIFTALCSSCHTLYGVGGKIGPDLTGSGRANLDYLLENIADPSAVVPAEYRLSTLTLKDGRAVSGIVKARTEHTLTLRTLAEELNIDLGDLVKEDISPLSMMPEGLLLALQPARPPCPVHARRAHAGSPAYALHTPAAAQRRHEVRQQKTVAPLAFHAIPDLVRRPVLLRDVQPQAAEVFDETRQARHVVVVWVVPVDVAVAAPAAYVGGFFDQLGDVLLGDDATDDHRNIEATGPYALDDERRECHVGSGEHRQTDGVDVLVDSGGRHLLRGLEQTGVDDLVARIAQGPGHDFHTTVVTVESGLCHHNTNGRCHTRLPLVGHVVPPYRSTFGRRLLSPR